MYTGHNDFSSAASLTMKRSTARPPDSDCDSDAEIGRVVYRERLSSSEGGILYLCQSTETGTAWKASTYAYGTDRPQSCEPGELYFDLDAPFGQQWLGCVATDTWMTLGGGAGIPTHASDAGKLLGTDGGTASWRSIAGFTDDGAKLVPNGHLLGELDGNNLWSGHQSYPASAPQTIAGPDSKITCNRHTVAISAAAPVTLNSTATIEDGSNGQVCVIVNTGVAPVVLQDEDALPESNLQLNAARWPLLRRRCCV